MDTIRQENPDVIRGKMRAFIKANPNANKISTRKQQYPDGRHVTVAVPLNGNGVKIVDETFGRIFDSYEPSAVKAAFHDVKREQSTEISR